jgi:hypothetical protein
MIIINVIIDKSRLFYKIKIKNIDETYRILNYTRIKPRSRPPQKKKKPAHFTHPDFSEAKLEKKCANYASKYGNSIMTTMISMPISKPFSTVAERTNSIYKN